MQSRVREKKTNGTKVANCVLDLCKILVKPPRALLSPKLLILWRK
jgi:hypothetical protein